MSDLKTVTNTGLLIMNKLKKRHRSSRGHELLCYAQTLKLRNVQRLKSKSEIREWIILENRQK